jgi:NAD(P)-dependent dehydrogenase (short-subunit alcohol dehydrogenase family)
LAGGYAITAAHPATALLNLDMEGDADSIVARSTAFAAGAVEAAHIITLIQGGADWPATQRFACLAAFTRHAARTFASRRVQVNAVAIGVPGPTGWNAADALSGSVPAEPATPADLARIVLAMLGFPSMTGQLIRLGA